MSDTEPDIEAITWKNELQKARIEELETSLARASHLLRVEEGKALGYEWVIDKFIHKNGGCNYD